MATNYESEITKFLKDYKQSHPGTEERQREGRARLWDKPQDAELLEGFRAARVPQSRTCIRPTDTVAAAMAHNPPSRRRPGRASGTARRQHARYR